MYTGWLLSFGLFWLLKSAEGGIWSRPIPSARGPSSSSSSSSNSVRSNSHMGESKRYHYTDFDSVTTAPAYSSVELANFALETVGPLLLPSALAYLGYKCVEALRRFLTLRREKLSVEDVEIVEEMKKEQDEMWQAITALHSMHAETKSLLDASQGTVSSFASRLNEMDVRLAGKLASAFKQIDSLGETNRLNEKRLVEQLGKLNLMLNASAIDTAVKLQDVRAYTKEILADYDSTMVRKLKAFKDELKKVFIYLSERNVHGL